MEFDIDFSSGLFGESEVTYACDCAKNQPVHQDWVFSKIHETPQHFQETSSHNRVSRRNKQRRSTGRRNTSSDCEQSAGEECEWTTAHPSVGKKVEKVFDIQGTLEAYVGEVVSYLPPSQPQCADQLYKIMYDDDDVEDFDQAEYNEGRKAFQASFADTHHQLN